MKKETIEFTYMRCDRCGCYIGMSEDTPKVGAGLLWCWDCGFIRMELMKSQNRYNVEVSTLFRHNVMMPATCLVPLPSPMVKPPNSRRDKGRRRTTS